VNGKALQPKPGWATQSGFAVPPCAPAPDTASTPDRVLTQMCHWGLPQVPTDHAAFRVTHHVPEAERLVVTILTGLAPVES